jgi:hypothetical protein
MKREFEVWSQDRNGYNATLLYDGPSLLKALSAFISNYNKHTFVSIEKLDKR